MAPSLAAPTLKAFGSLKDGAAAGCGGGGGEAATVVAGVDGAGTAPG
jgi:hypothetical protein